MTSVLSPSEDEEEDEDESTTWREQTIALDTIQQTIDHDDDDDDSAKPMIGLVTPITTEAAVIMTPKQSRYQNSSHLTPTSQQHSPSLLNPIRTEPWEEEKKLDKTNLLCPALEEQQPSNTMESLIQRLQGGFRVNLHENSSVEPVFLFLKHRSHLCIARQSHCWEIPVQKILRLEFGKTHSHPMTCFSIVANQDSNIIYYDLEAKSPIEREVLVSTLMVVLEQVSHPLVKQSKSYHETDYDIGTMDAPIPCSPSLDQPAPIIPCSPSLELEMRGETHLSPQKRTQIHNEDEGTETSLVIHLEDALSNDSIQVVHENNTNGRREQLVAERNQVAPVTPPQSEEERMPQVTDLSNFSVKPMRTVRTFSNKLPDDDVSNIAVTPRLSVKAFSNEEPELDKKPDEATDLTGMPAKPKRSELIGKVLSNEELQKDEPDNVAGASESTLLIQPERSELVLKTSKEEPPADKIDKAEPDQAQQEQSNALVNPQPSALTINTMSEEELFVDKPDDLKLELVPSVVSGAQLAGAWCSDDICTLALRDIADTCTGIFELKQKAQASCLDTVSIEQMVMIEEYITAALGAPSAMYSYLTEPEVWNSEVITAPPKSDPKDPKLNNRIRNRASQLNAQAVRLRGLQKEMTFAAALKQSKERMHVIKTTHSFDDNRLSRRNPKQTAANEAADQFHASALLQTLVESMVYDSQDVAKMVEKKDKDEEVFYDSDPEDARPRRTRQDPRRVSAELQNQMDDSSVTKNTPSQRLALSGAGFDRVKSNKKVSKRMDEDAVIEIVQAMNNERLALLWHPTQTKKLSNRSPVCVKMWVEAGVYLNDGTILLPKLTWVKASDDESTKVIHMQKSVQLHKLDLLDICRIRPTEKIDRQRHPFAIASRSFIVETQSEIFLMETRTTEERDRIVYALKLVIARLASLLMLRDIRAADEFFGTVAPMVPGEAPIWGKGSSSSA